MGFETIDVPELPLPGQFSHVVRKGKMVFISGQTADNEGAAGNLDPYAHAERVFDYLEKAIKAAGGDLTDIVKIVIFHHEMMKPLPARPDNCKAVMSAIHMEKI